MELQLLEQKSAYIKVLLRVDKQDIAEGYQAQIKKFAKTAQIKGFRPGKAPEGLICKMAGNDIFYECTSKFIEQQINGYAHEQQLNLLFPALIKPVDEAQGLANNFETFESVSYWVEFLPVNKFENPNWENCFVEFPDYECKPGDVELFKNSLNEKFSKQSEIEQDFKGENGLVTLNIIHPISQEPETFSLPYSKLTPEFNLFLKDYKPGDSISYKVKDMLLDHTQIKYSINEYDEQMDEIETLTLGSFFNSETKSLSLQEMYELIPFVLKPNPGQEAEEPQEVDEVHMQQVIESYISTLKLGLAMQQTSREKTLQIADSLNLQIDRDLVIQTLENTLKPGDKFSPEQWNEISNYWTSIYIQEIVGSTGNQQRLNDTDTDFGGKVIVFHSIAHYIKMGFGSVDTPFEYTELLKNVDLFNMVLGFNYNSIVKEPKKAQQTLADYVREYNFWKTVLENAHITLVSE